MLLGSTRPHQELLVGGPEASLGLSAYLHLWAIAPIITGMLRIALTLMVSTSLGLANEIFVRCVSNGASTPLLVLESVYGPSTTKAIQSALLYRSSLPSQRWLTRLDHTSLNHPFIVAFGDLAHHRMRGATDQRHACLLQMPHDGFQSQLPTTIATWRHEGSHFLLPEAGSTHVPIPALEPDEWEIRLMELNRAFYHYEQRLLLTPSDALYFLDKYGSKAGDPEGFFALYHPDVAELFAVLSSSIPARRAVLIRDIQTRAPGLR